MLFLLALSLQILFWKNYFEQHVKRSFKITPLFLFFRFSTSCVECWRKFLERSEDVFGDSWLLCGLHRTHGCLGNVLFNQEEEDEEDDDCRRDQTCSEGHLVCIFIIIFKKWWELIDLQCGLLNIKSVCVKFWNALFFISSIIQNYLINIKSDYNNIKYTHKHKHKTCKWWK